LNQKIRMKMTKQNKFPNVTEELCNYCKVIKTFRKTNGVPKCAVCEAPGFMKKEELIIDAG